ncbi:hypothetical protein L1987_40528 [Smallanthus sonchifolius]|uniref:Uncharacterized protein n=1 Tax=Smallanthus sonchifolius TaxID=185202 RepID=A0ACB9GUA6_9ASTR|nr:hypothetical protein L1987_40528 [Smallanthus sonchifolius]
MGRTGKEHVGSSSNPDENPQRKRRLVRLADQDQDEEEEQQAGPGPKPKWEAGPLDDQPEYWQPILFHDRMNKLKDRAAAFICEREVKEDEFGPFNVFNRFRALGWEAALRCYDRDSKNLFKEEIQEWMATLTCPPYSKPQKMKLIGTVNGIEVEMSFDTLRRVAKFDSRHARDYMFPTLDDLFHKPEAHPRWNDMLEALFLPGTWHGTLYRKNLKIEAKLLLMICVCNVIPTRGDKVEVRFPEVPVLYSLLHGSPRFPFRFLVLNNVWICRNKVGRSIIPHCRLITALLKMYGVIGLEDKGAPKKHKPFDIRKMGQGWSYTESERHHKLKCEGQRWRALKVDARALQPGEEDEPETDDVPQSGDEDYVEEPNAEEMNVDQEGPSRSHVHEGVFFDYSSHPYEPNWAHQGTMQEVIENQRPPTFDSWPESNRTFFDHQTFMGASMERALKHNSDRQESWNRTHAYAFEQEVNNRYLDDQNRRMHDDWHAGRPVVADPPLVDYSTLPPYDGSVSYPTPPLHYSQWVDPRQSQQYDATQQGGSEGGSGSGTFAFGEFSEMMTSIFGPPQPRYY